MFSGIPFRPRPFGRRFHRDPTRETLLTVTFTVFRARPDRVSPYSGRPRFRGAEMGATTLRAVFAAAVHGRFKIRRYPRKGRTAVDQLFRTRGSVRVHHTPLVCVDRLPRSSPDFINRKLPCNASDCGTFLAKTRASTAIKHKRRTVCIFYELSPPFALVPPPYTSLVRSRRHSNRKLQPDGNGRDAIYTVSSIS